MMPMGKALIVTGTRRRAGSTSQPPPSLVSVTHCFESNQNPARNKGDDLGYGRPRGETTRSLPGTLGYGKAGTLLAIEKGAAAHHFHLGCQCPPVAPVLARPNR